MIFSKIILYLSIMLLSFELFKSCSCLQSKSATDELIESDAVFTGRVIKIEKIKDKNIVNFQVFRTFKGKANTNITIRTLSESSLCGYPFIRGSSYIVFAYKYKGRLDVILCSRTSLVQDAGKDIRELDKLLRS